MIARVGIEHRHAEDADEVQPEQDDDEAGRNLQLALVALDELAEVGGTGSEPDEHRGKAQDEQHGCEDHAPPDEHSADRR